MKKNNHTDCCETPEVHKDLLKKVAADMPEETELYVDGNSLWA